MKVFLLISLLLSLYYCGNVSAYSASNVSESISRGIGAAHDLTETVKNIDEIKKSRQNRNKPKPKPRARRFSESLRKTDAAIGKAVSGVRSILKTYVAQPIAHGNFKETPIRSSTIWTFGEGQYILGSLDGEANQSYKSLMKNRRTGDIIACKIPGNELAEHYMMVIKEGKIDGIAEVTVVGGKKSTSNNGVLEINPYRSSSYYDSEKCLKHENRVIQTASAIDDDNRSDTETNAKIDEIIDRFSATVNALESSSTKRFNYDLYSCNCQDFVLYWAYGYVNHNGCIKQLFSDKEIPHELSLINIFRYIDRDGSAREELFGGYERSLQFANIG